VDELPDEAEGSLSNSESESWSPSEWDEEEELSFFFLPVFRPFERPPFERDADFRVFLGPLEDLGGLAELA
jgi:hypothetical protein